MNNVERKVGIWNKRGEINKSHAREQNHSALHARKQQQYDVQRNLRYRQFGRWTLSMAGSLVINATDARSSPNAAGDKQTGYEWRN